MSDSATVRPTAAPEGSSGSEELLTPRGETTIAPGVVATVAKQAASEVDGVEVVSRGGLHRLFDAVRSGGGSGVQADVASRHTAVELTVAVCWPRPVRQVTDEVRDHVRARVQELTGYEVTDVDIAVDGLPTPSRPRRVE